MVAILLSAASLVAFLVGGSFLMKGGDPVALLWFAVGHTMLWPALAITAMGWP